MEKTLERVGERFNFSESYTSLLLGIVVVIAAALLFMSFVKSRKVEVPPPPLQTEKISQELEKIKQEDVKDIHIVAAGDTLWSIAETYYKSGYDWVKIAQANNISDPASIEVGTKLKVPGVDTRIIATSTSTETQQIQKTEGISGNSYKIKQDDTLWDIAIRAYGDAYKWPEIARANSLENPDLIYPENELKLPR